MLKIYHLCVKFFVACTLLLILLSCNEETFDRKALRPQLTQRNYDLCKDVICYYDPSEGDTVCYDQRSRTQLPSGHFCTQNLIPVAPSSPPASSPPPSLPPSRSISITVSDSDMTYGLDDSREYYPIDPSANENRITYLSVKEGAAILLKITINEGIFNNFDIMKVKIEGSDISFDSISAIDTCIIQDTATIISLYGRYASSFETKLIVSGISRSGLTKELVCDTCEESILVVCYTERALDTLRVYRVNNPSFNPTDTILKKEFNKILKQTVFRVDSVRKQTYDSANWDNNGNGILDLFPIADSVPEEMLEHKNLIQAVESVYPGCNSCWYESESSQEAKVFILPGTIQRAWLVMDDAIAGSDIISVQYSEEYNDFLRNDTMLISTWDGSSSEKIMINHIEESDERQNRMVLKLYSFFKDTLTNSYARNSVLLEKTGKVKGLTHQTKSCSFVENENNYRNIIHEFLHMAVIGPLSHADEDTTNIMFYRAGNYGTQLRYREISSDDSYGNGAVERQWKIIQNK